MMDDKLRIGPRTLPKPIGNPVKLALDSSNKRQTINFEGLVVAAAATGERVTFGTFQFPRNARIVALTFSAAKTVAGVFTMQPAQLQISGNPANQIMFGGLQETLPSASGGLDPTQLRIFSDQFPATYERFFQVAGGQPYIFEVFFGGTYAAADTLEAMLTIEVEYP